VEEVVTWVGFPVRGFAASGDDDAVAEFGTAWGERDGGGEVHVEGDGAQDSVGVIYQADEIAQGSFAAKIEYAVEGWVVMAFFADLDELEAALEVVDDRLPTPAVPRFNGIVIFPAGGDDPVGWGISTEWLEEWVGGEFVLGEVDVSFKGGGSDAEAELIVKVFYESVDEVIGEGVALVDERVVGFEALGLRVGVLEGSEAGIVSPEVWAGGADVGEELARVAVMEVADGSGEHDDVPGGQPVLKDEFLLHRTNGWWSWGLEVLIPGETRVPGWRRERFADWGEGGGREAAGGRSGYRRRVGHSSEGRRRSRSG